VAFSSEAFSQAAFAPTAWQFGTPPAVVVAGALAAARDELGARPVLLGARRPAGQGGSRPAHTAAPRPALTGGRRR
jgi:hypothetical protein